MNKTIKKINYFLRYNSDRDKIWAEAEPHGCELTTGNGYVVVSMWETNPYNTWFVLKHRDNFSHIKSEDWYI